MKRVTGIGGVFFKARDPEALRAWYRDHLGIEIDDWGSCSFSWNGPATPSGEGSTVWSIFDADSDYFASSSSPFMINYRVEDLRALIEQLREEGCEVDARLEESEFGKFGWVTDLEGNRVELWQPPPGK